MDQEIPQSGGDYISNADQSSWVKGKCPPTWKTPTDWIDEASYADEPVWLD